MFVCPSVCLSVHLKLKISETTEPTKLYSSRNIPNGPVVVQRLARSFSTQIDSVTLLKGFTYIDRTAEHQAAAG